MSGSIGTAILLPSGKLLLRTDGKLALTLTGGATYSGTLTAGQPTATRIYQRDTRTGGAFGKGAGTVGLSVTLSAAATTLEYRLRDADASGNPMRQDWTALAGSTAVGTATLSPSIPASAFRYLIDVRANGAAASIILGTQAFGVGEVVALSGQSLAANSIYMDTSDTTTLVALGLAAPATSAEFATRDTDTAIPPWGHVLDGQRYQAAYAAELLRVLSVNAGVPVALIGYAYSGTPISAWAPGQTNNNQLKAVLTAAGGKFGAFVWVQGHNDVGVTSAATWTAAYNAIASDLASSFPAAAFVRVLTTIPAILSNGYGPQGVQTIRSAAEGIAAAAPANTAHVEPMDAPMNADGIHPIQAGYATMGRQHARAIARLSGISTAGPGPLVSGAARSIGSNVLHLTLSNSGTALIARTNAQFGTASTPSAATLARQFGVFASPLAYVSSAPQGAVVVSSAVIVDATHIDLTLAATPAGAVSLDVVVRMPLDDSSAVSTGIYDNQVDADGLTTGRLMRVTGNPVTALAS